MASNTFWWSGRACLKFSDVRALTAKRDSSALPMMAANGISSGLLVALSTAVWKARSACTHSLIWLGFWIVFSACATSPIYDGGQRHQQRVVGGFEHGGMEGQVGLHPFPDMAGLLHGIQRAGNIGQLLGFVAGSGQRRGGGGGEFVHTRPG